MRIARLSSILLVAVVASMLLLTSAASAGPFDGYLGSPCFSCGAAHDGMMSGHCGKLKGYFGMNRHSCDCDKDYQAWFNCNCNGSYKFPVPPLYTYHWPGMYSHQMMTNYHSPWRVPPITRYKDASILPFRNPEGDMKPEGIPGTSGAFRNNRRLSRPARFSLPIELRHDTSGGIVEPMSEKMRRMYR